MRGYIAVMHHWFICSEGFTEKAFEAANRHEADKIAALLCHERRRDFRDVAVHLIDIGEVEKRFTVVSLKLSWWERISGRLNRSGFVTRLLESEAPDAK